MYVGDFNLAKINWSVNSELFPFFVSSDIKSFLVDFMSHNGFKQINNIYNDKSHILDLVFVDHDVDANLFLPISPLFKKSFHHSSITVEFSVLNYQPDIDNSCL